MDLIHFGHFGVISILAVPLSPYLDGPIRQTDHTGRETSYFCSNASRRVFVSQVIKAISHEWNLGRKQWLLAALLFPKDRLHCFLNDVVINNYSIQLVYVSESFSANKSQVCLAHVHTHGS
jgi:hypothetical protein